MQSGLTGKGEVTAGRDRVGVETRRLRAMGAARQALLPELLRLGGGEVSGPAELPEEAFPALCG